MPILLRGGTVVSAYNRRQLDIRIDGEQIVEMGVDLPVESSQTEDVTGCYVLPDFIDAYTHLKLDNGKGSLDTADNFTAGSQTVVTKGMTTVIDMVTSSKGGSLEDCLATWNQLTEGKSSYDYTYRTSMIEWELTVAAETQEIIVAGITSFKMHTTYDNLRTTDAETFEAMKEIKKVNGMLGVHCENGNLVDELTQSYASQGKLTSHYYPLPRPATAEAGAVARYLMMTEMTDLSASIMHLSIKRSLEVMKRARQRGQPVYAETCPQYLLLDDHLYDAPDSEAAKYVCSPPLRRREDQQALWQGIKGGAIGTISTDHCSFNLYGQKTTGKDDFSKIPNGMSGVEARPELIYTGGVAEDRIILEKMVALLSENIAKQFSMYPQKGAVQEGGDADLVIWDPRTTGVIAARTQLQNVDCTPYEGFETQGQARMAYSRDQKVAEAGQVILTDQRKFVLHKAA